MTEGIFLSNKEIDVIIIGAGPAGLGAATELKKQGIERVIVLERECEAGGIPRHCGHPPFGMREFQRVLTGQQYAKKLVKTAVKAGVEIYTSVNVVELNKAASLLITGDFGVKKISAKRIIYATGVREATRSSRLISGDRTTGIINTGTLQQMVFLQKLRPFKRPVIIGSELVAFSAILTCRHAKIKPVAMIEADKRAIAQFPIQYSTPILGVPLYLNSELLNIIGDEQVSAVEIRKGNGQIQNIACDGVILTGNYIPEATLGRMGHLEIDNLTSGVKVDQFGRCSDPFYFATGNLLRAVETAGWSWKEGKQIASFVVADLQGKLAKSEKKIKIVSRDPLIKLFMPQEISSAQSLNGMKNIQLRFTKEVTGELVAVNSKGIIWKRKLHAKREKRFLIPVKQLLNGFDEHKIELKFLENKNL